MDEIIAWLTGYDAQGLATAIDDERDLESFFAQAPAKNPNRTLIEGMVCGVRVEEIEDPIKLLDIALDIVTVTVKQDIEGYKVFFIPWDDDI